MDDVAKHTNKNKNNKICIEVVFVSLLLCLSFLLCNFSFKCVDDGKVFDLMLNMNFSYEECLIVCSGRRGIDMLIYFLTRVLGK